MTSQRSRALLVCVAAAGWGAFVCAHAFTHPAQIHAAFTDHPIDGFPFWREAVMRAFRAVLGAALTVIAAWQCGARLVGPRRDLFATWLERAQFTLATGLVALSLLLLVLGWTGAYRPPIVAAIIVGLVISRPPGARGDWRRSLGILRHRARAVVIVWSDVAYAVCFAVAIGVALIAALAPEVEYDALWYHLWLPSQWLDTGRLTDVVSEYISLYPGTWELLNGAAMAIGGPVAAKLLHTACLPLLAGAAVLLSAQVAPRVPAVLVAALVATVPTLLWDSSTAYVDVALAWLSTLTVVALFRHHQTEDRRWVLLAGVTAGGALGVKHLGLIVLAICAVALLVRELQWRRWGAGLRASATFTLLALTLASPWYVRAYAASGNPVFPEFYAVFGAQPPTRWSDGTERALRRFQARFGMGRRPAALLALPWNVTVHAARFGGTIGPAFLALAPFALVSARRRTLGVLAIGAAAYAAVWASPIGSFQLRFIAPVVPVLAVLAAAGAAEIADAARRLHRSLGVVPHVAIVLLLLLNLPPFVDWHETERRGFDGWLTHVLRAMPAAVVLGAESGESYLSRSVPTYRAWRAVDTGTPAASRILTFVSGDQLYSHRPRLWSDAAVAFPLTWGAHAGEESATRRQLRRFGVTHVLFDKRQFTDPAFRALAIASPATRVCCLAPFYEDERIAVYRVVNASSEEGGSGLEER